MNTPLNPDSANNKSVQSLWSYPMIKITMLKQVVIKHIYSCLVFDAIRVVPCHSFCLWLMNQVQTQGVANLGTASMHWGGLQPNMKQLDESQHLQVCSYDFLLENGGLLHLSWDWVAAQVQQFKYCISGSCSQVRVKGNERLTARLVWLQYLPVNLCFKPLFLIVSFR